MRRMIYIIIGIIVLAVLFTLYKGNDKTNSVDNGNCSQLNIERELIENDKRIVIGNISFDDVRSAVEDFTKNYDNPKQKHLKPISKLHIMRNKSVITFPYDINFEIFCYLVNYLKYPMDLEYKADIVAWATTQSTDYWLNSDFDNEKMMIFIDPNDTEYDNVMLVSKSGNCYRIGFAVGDGLEKQYETVFKYISPELQNSDLNQLEFEEIQ